MSQEDQHPLAVLRALTGDTQESYAQLVSATHLALGFGPLRSRREKVSRWETQGVPPDYHTQLAIAHVHQVPESEVLRLGWPQWLHLGTAAVPRSERVGNGESPAPKVVQPSRPGTDRGRLGVTGQALVRFVQDVVAELQTGPAPGPGHRLIGADTADLVEDRARTLHAMLPTANPVALQRAACAEFELTNVLLKDSRYDRATSLRLHIVAAQIAHLCGWISKVLDEDAKSERCLLVSARAASRAGARELTVACLATLAWLHIEVGDPRDALFLVESAQAVAPGMPVRARIVLRARQARAHARLGQIIAAAKALNVMADLGASPPPDDSGLYTNVDDDWVLLTTARTWLDAGHARRASEHFASVLVDGDPGTSRQPPLLVARDLLGLVDAQLMLGEVEAAASTARRAMSLFDRVPIGLLSAYRTRFTRWCRVKVVQDLMATLVSIPLYRP